MFFKNYNNNLVYIFNLFDKNQNFENLNFIYIIYQIEFLNLMK